MEKRELKFFAILAAALIILGLFAVFYVSHLDQIKQKAIGTELVYVSFGGVEITETVTAEDITAITFVSCPNSDKGCYRVSIKEDPLWHIYYDAFLFELVEIEQLFVT